MREDARRVPLAAVAAAVVGVAAAAGGEPAWARGLAAVLVGGLLIWRPLLPGLPRLFWIGMAFAGAWALLGLLPLPLQRPDWWNQARALGIALPASWSPQPWRTAETLLWWVLPVALFCWVNAAGTQRDRIWALRVFAMGAVVLAAAVWVGNVLGWRNPLIPDPECFSLFPNRNQTSLLLAMGGNLAWGYALGALRTRNWRMVGAALVACSVALGAVTLLPSRAALALFLFGLTLQTVLRARRLPGSWKLTAPLLLLLLGAGLSHGRHIYLRMAALETEAGRATEARQFIYQDALRMVGDVPLAGAGAGNFEPVFGRSRQASRSYLGVRHPENDWLWLMAEAGIPCALGAAVALASLAYRGTRDRRIPAAQQAAGVAVLLFLLHGLVDVPAHRLGTSLAAALLLALWLDPQARDTGPRARLAIRAAGLVLVAVGGVWLASLRFPSLHSSTALATVDDSSATAADVQAALHWQPLAWQPHFRDALLQLDAGDGPAARAAFRRVRFLEPVSARPAFQEGMAWLDRNPDEALAAWRVALEREVVHPVEVFQEMVHNAQGRPQLQHGLARLSLLDASTFALYIRKGPQQETAPLLRGWAAQPTPAPLHDSPQLGPVLERLAHGDPAAAQAAIARWQVPAAVAWRAQFTALSQLGDRPAALRLAVAHMPIPALEHTEPDARTSLLQARLATNPDDLSAGIELLARQLDTAPQDALLTLDWLARSKTPPPGIPAWRLKALVLLERWDEAWEVAERLNSKG